MHPIVVGISHKTAPLELRERFALSGDEAACLARDLLDCDTVTEAVVLSTCNRTEAYLLAADARVAERFAVGRLAERGGVEVAALRAASQRESDGAAIAHLFRVAASLDSMVVGEAQILAQLKDAYQAACDHGCTSVVFNRLFRQAIEAGKRVRTETAIGERPASVSSVAVDLARQKLGTLERRVVLVLGAGETSELTVRHLRAQGAGAVVVANRTLASAEELADRCEGRAVCLDELDAQLVAADIVISSTAAPGFLVDRPRLAEVMRRRSRRPMFLIDIAVPRDIDPDIGRLDGCTLCDIDDLQGAVATNHHERERAIAQAERIVDEEVARMNDWLAGLEVVPTIARLRSTVEAVREAELARLGGKLAALSPAQRVEVEQLTTAIVNKILHVPTVRLKQLAVEPDAYVYVDALRRLFDLEGDGPAPEALRGGPAGR
jgi:glutamyl-tRNA reductase